MPDPTRRHRLPSLLLGGLLAALTMAGCAVAHGTPVTANTVDGVPTNLYLDGELLTTSDLPGWTTMPADSSGGGAGGQDSGPACFQSVDRIAQPTTDAEAAFERSGGAPNVQELLGAFPTGIESTFAQMRSILDRCGPIDFTAGGEQFTGNVGPTAISAVGNDTFAYKAALTTHADDRTVALGMVLAATWKHQTLTVVVYFSGGAPDVASTATILQQAEAKVS